MQQITIFNTRFWKNAALSLGFLASSTALHAQVTGTKTIGVDYATLNAAITDLNTNGISGAVTINVPAGYTETAPSGGYQLGSTVLNGSTSAGSTLTIRKNGAGANPLLTAPVGTSTTVDGIFIIKGTDYVTIDGISLAESAANTTATAQMEWGYALVKLNAAAPFDGSHNVTITNCGITLNQANTPSTGIYSGNHVASVNTALAITATSDAANNNTFSSNNITNVNTGISLNGYLAAASPYDLYDQGNAISGNTITNFGGTTAATYGVYLAAQNNASALGNNFTSAATPGTGVIRGIFHGLGNNSSFTASSNIFQLRASTGAIYGIANGTGAANTGINGTGTITITNNTFQNYSFSAANSATHYFGVYNYAGTTSGWALGSIVMNNNVVQNMNNLNATGTIYLFYNYYCNANDVRFNNNKINSMFRSTTAGNTYCYYNYYGNPTAGADSVVGNKISNVSSPYSLYGIYDYMGISTRDRVIMNDTLINDTASKGSTFYYFYGIYAYYGNNVTIRNCRITNNYSVPTNSGYNYSIYRQNGTTATVTDNVVANNSGYSAYGIYTTGSSGNTLVTNNSISNLSATTSTIYGLYSSATGTNDVFNNTIRNLSSTSGSIYGLYNGGGTTVNYYNDTVYNATSTTSGSIYGFYNGGGTTINAYNLHVGRLANTGTAGSANGLYAIGGTTLNFYNNLVDSITANGTTGNAYGVYESGPSIFNVYKNKISYVSANGTGGSVNGMYLNSGTVTAYNNLIGNLHTPAFSTTTASGGTQLVGIYCGSATAANLYYNTISINATSTGTNFGSTGIYANTAVNLTMNNNIVVNNSTPAGTGMVAAYRRNSTTLTSYVTSSDNNLFYAGTPSPNTVILWDGTAAYQTLADYKLLVSPRDGAAVTENVTFQSLTGIGNTFLHPSTTIATQIESNGVNIPGITDDHYGTTRAGNPGYTGTGVAPDLGAVEDNYIPIDLSAPNISYSPLSYTCATGDRTFTATITDVTGVPTSGSLVPRVYYRKPSGVWFSKPGTLTSGTATSGTWSFTISASDMGGLAVGDLVFYFIIAQDMVATPNIGSDPSGAVATDVNTITTYPPSPNSYNIALSLSGTYTVGVGGAYTTLTEAVAAYNAGCMGGPVTFSLIDAAYPSETFPLTISSNPFASAVNTLTIRPAAGVSPTISGSSTTGLIMLDAADYVIIDGSNSPTPNSICPPAAASRDLTIKNTSTGTASAVIWLRSVAGDGATHNIIRNTNISGSASTATLFGIGSGGTTIAYTSSGTGNNYNRYENNSIRAAQTGIFTRGANATAKNVGTVINQNVMNGTAPDNLRNNGIFTNFEDSVVISGNTLANITNSISNDIIAINLGFNNNSTTVTITTGNDVTNATVTYNKLDNISQTNTWSCLGIAVNGVSSGTTLIANNMISGVIAKGTGSDFSAGIFIGGATGGVTNVFYNAVNVTGTLTGGTYPNYAIAVSGTNPIVNLKNNIFVNNNTAATASLQYAIGLAYSTYTNLSSDHNDFFSVGTDLANVGNLGTTGTEQPTLAAWRTTTGQDANSKNINPVFVSASDLRVAAVADNLPLMDSGVVVSVTTDIDCNSRSATPDIGVNEFTIPPCGTITAGAISAVTDEFCGSGSTTLNLPTASTGLGITYQWYSSTDSASWTPISGAVTHTYTTDTLTVTTYFRVKLTCTVSGSTDSASTSIVIHPLPVITTSPDGGAICTTGTGLTMTASGASTYSWAPATGLSTATGPTVIANPALSTTYTITGTDVFGCVGTHAVTITVSTPPDSITVTPAFVTMCEGDTAHLLTAVGPTTPATDSPAVTSGTISVPVPDASAVGVSTPLTVAGIPAGATITGVDVNFNITMTFDGDLAINLTAPNGNTLNMVNRRGGGGDNFANTTISSNGVTPVSTGTAPFTGVFAADLATTAVGITSLPITTGVWAALYSTPNGDWKLSARDFASGDAATITSWTITVHYTYSPIVTWSGLAGLFTDASATTPYTGTATTTVYARPTATTTYTATMAVGGCSSTATATVSVNPLPTPFTMTGGGGYCPGSTGTAIGLSNSEIGINYQLYLGATAVGTPVAGTGSAISFGFHTATGTYSVIGTNTTTGCTGSMGSTVAVYIHAVPATFAVTGGGSYCAGGAGVAIGLSGSQAAVSYQLYNGTTPVGAPVAGTGSAISFGLQTAAGTYTVVATGDTTGCSSNMTGSATISIDPLPVAFTVTGGGSYCAGGTGVVVGLSGSAVGINYQLYNGSTPSGSPVAGTGGPISFGLHVAGTYTVRATNTSTGCTNNMTGSATIIALAVPTVYSVTGGGSYCSGGAGLPIGMSNSQLGITYQLYNGSTTVGSPVAGTGTAFSFGTFTASGTYTVSAANAIGCPANMSGSATIIINPLPAVYTVTGGGVYCEGGTGVPVGLSNSEPGISYQLFNGGTVGSPVVGTGSAISFGLQTLAGTYLVIATNTATGCTSPMDGSADVFINPTTSPIVTISNPLGDTVCSSTFVLYTAIPTFGGFSPTYQWSVNGVPTGTGVTFGYIPVTGDVVKVVITSSSCASPDTASSSVTMTVTSLVTPSVTISSSVGDSTCAGTPATFTATPVFGGPAPTYRWVKNGINVATGPTYTTLPANGDVVYVVMNSSYPCTFVDSVTSNTIIMHVSPVTTPTVTIGAHPGLVIAPGQSDTLIANVYGATATSYQWRKNGVIIPGATNAVYITNTLANGDVISVIVNASTTCGSVIAMANVTISVTGGAGISQTNNDGMEIRLLPNPNKGTFTVKGDLGITTDKEVTFEITNLLGQVVYKSTVIARNGQINEVIQLDNSLLANGMYMFTLKTDNENKTINFVIGQ